MTLAQNYTARPEINKIVNEEGRLAELLSPPSNAEARAFNRIAGIT